MTPGLWSLLIQATGSAATVLASVWVSWRFGLAAQGEYALLRSSSDAVVALLTLGLPQGLMHLQYREGFSAQALHPVVWRVVAATLAGVLVFSAAAMQWPAVLPLPAAVLVTLALAMPFWLGQRLWRALALRALGVVPHAVLTALPTWLIFLGVLGLGALNRGEGFEQVLALAAVLSGLASVLAFRAWRTQAVALPQGTLWEVSFQTLGQTLLAAVMPAALLGLAKGMGASLAEVGVLSLGLLVYELFAVLAGYSAPLLYDRAARLAPEHSTRPLTAWVRRAGLPFLGLALTCAFVLPWLAGLFWPRLAGHEGPTTAMALAGLLALCARLWATTLQAQGRVSELSWQALGRLVVGLGAMAGLHHPLGILLAAPLALVLMELLTLWRLWHLWREQERASA